MTRGRVLLVEDDASIRRFVRLALDRLPIELVDASTLQEARVAIDAQKTVLIIADLTLPDGNGLDFVTNLPAVPTGLVPPRVLIFSAGISVPIRQRAKELGIWGLLDKPASVAALVDAVCRALELEGSVTGVRPHGQAVSLRDRFNGRSDLFDAFVSATVAGFPEDIGRGDAAIAKQDVVSLRREAHNLKSVLQLMGADEWSALARRLEALTEDPFSDPQELAALWRQLSAGLRTLG
jgi:CheY-like chemotaxis protein/HPt (histidine-containing phosphotransfer) domain-containing protein